MYKEEEQDDYEDLKELLIDIVDYGKRNQEDISVILSLISSGISLYTNEKSKKQRLYSRRKQRV